MSTLLEFVTYFAYGLLLEACVLVVIQEVRDARQKAQ